MKQAPSWNKITKLFGSNPDVVFGDVLLSDDQVRTINGEAQNPGAGGWPTVRYYNKDTGGGGKAYTKLTDEAMCDELGKEDAMQAYVELAATTSLCSVTTGAGCSDKEKAFADKWKDKVGTPELDGQIARLEKMKAEATMAASLKTWLNQRLGVLGQLKKQEL